MTGALWSSDFFCFFLTPRSVTRHWPPSMIQCINLNFAAAGKRSRHSQSNIQISFQTRSSSIIVINNILARLSSKKEQSDIYNKVTSQVTFKMMLEHAKSDMRLKGLVGKLQPFEMPSFFLKFVYGSEVNRHRGICRWMSSSGPFNKANIFLGLIEYELNIFAPRRLYISSYSIRPWKIFANYLCCL